MVVTVQDAEKAFVEAFGAVRLKPKHAAWLERKAEVWDFSALL